MKNQKCIAKGTADTIGDGYWSKIVKQRLKVHIFPSGTFMTRRKNPSNYYGQLNVYFDTKVWNTKKYGLIYTDSLFEEHIKQILRDKGYRFWYDIFYSEQGMQSTNYVNFDVGHKLASELDKKGLIETKEG